MVHAIETDIRFAAEYQRMGSSPPAWQDPAPLILACAADLGAGGIVEVEIASLQVYADPMLGKVFCNLIANALDHGERVSRIAFTTEERDGGLVIVCEDNGIGIPPGEKEIIFSSGYGKHHGYGLFLIREILAITGILIQETGEAGKGARFEIYFPEGKYKKG
jgi:signal transduction histidine kinase